MKCDRNLTCIIASCCVLVLIGACVTFWTGSPGEEKRVDLSNTTCIYSENIGRRIFFHVCYKEESKIYDIRYFFKEDLKPQIIGVQLSELEFSKICRQCSI